MDKDNHESYKHFYAKKVLIQWLTESKGKFFSLKWKVYDSRIYDEYPFIIEDGKLLCGKDNSPWDMIPVKFCNCLLIYSDGLLKNNKLCKHKLSRNDQIPIRDELISHGYKIGIIADVVLIENDRIKYIFEIYNTNPLHTVKRNTLLKYQSENDVMIYEINSDYILRQIQQPDKWRGVKLSEDSKLIRRKKFKKYYKANNK